jgi:hypothetical protein
MCPQTTITIAMAGKQRGRQTRGGCTHTAGMAGPRSFILLVHHLHFAVIAIIKTIGRMRCKAYVLLAGVLLCVRASVQIKSYHIIFKNSYIKQYNIEF